MADPKNHRSGDNGSLSSLQLARMGMALVFAISVTTSFKLFGLGDYVSTTDVAVFIAALLLWRIRTR